MVLFQQKFFNLIPKINYYKRFIHKYICKMNRAYLRYLNNTEKFELSFQYDAPEYRVNRLFNFNRQANETISSFLSRISANIDKEVKKKNKKSEPLPVQVQLMLNKQQIDNNTACKDVFTDENNQQLLLSINNREYNILINAPWINVVALPNSIMAGFMVYPNKFETLFTDKSKSTYLWYKSKDKNHWELCRNSFIYQPRNEDIDYYLKFVCVPKNDKFDGASVETVSNVKVQAGPGLCPFEMRHKFTENKCGQDTFRVVSYNILADLYCDSDNTREVLHPYCPPYALHIDYRKQLFIKELLGYNADLICLQEVDRKIFNYDLNILFQQLDYGGDFCIKGGEVAEGLCLFYNNRKFKKLQSLRFVLSDEIHTNQIFTDIWKRIEKNSNLTQRILDRTTALQINILECLNTNDILIVGNTHLYFHPDADHIRLLQGGFIIRYLEKLVDDLKIKYDNKRLSLILCGDFNSVPECGIYQLYTTGSVPHNHIDYQSKTEEAVEDVELHQKFPLSSACGTPQYTNFTAGFAACLDYIFYQNDTMEVVQIVPMPSLEELHQHTALPSIVFPSDHIALIADLKLLQSN